MKIIRCDSSSIDIELGNNFQNITIQAFGERILNSSGFSISRNSIKQISPAVKKLSDEEKSAIAQAIAKEGILPIGEPLLKWTTKPMPIEIYGLSE